MIAQGPTRPEQLSSEIRKPELTQLRDVQPSGLDHALQFDHPDFSEGDREISRRVDHAWLRTTSPGRAYSAMRDATFTI